VIAEHAAARAFAWGGAMLFAAALVHFVFSYSVTFGEIAAAEAGPGAIVFNVALFSAFALHHSIFAREPVRAFVRRTVSAGLERSVYVWIASLMLIGVCYAWRPVAGVAWQIPAPWTWAAVAVQLGGVWITLRGAAAIDVFDLAGVRQSANPGFRSEFRTDGPYGWVRHPIYLGWMLIVFGVGTMTMTRLVFAVVSSIYLLVAIRFEERTIRALSAGHYDEYMTRVPWKLIPRVF
jgi:protein-S-isoprenylcysteine O-methyltransferase Ste14